MKERPKEHPIEGRQNPTLSHGPDFVREASSLLKRLKETFPGSGRYRIYAGSEVYLPVLNFLVEDLQKLVTPGEVLGHRIGRSDSTEVIERFASFLRSKLVEVEKTGSWRSPNLKDFKDIYGIDLEVLKTEIYPNWLISGVCYSLDLNVLGSGQNRVPAGFVLERFFVKTSPVFSVKRNGAVSLSIKSGGLVVDLDESRVFNEHLGGS